MKKLILCLAVLPMLLGCTKNKTESQPQREAEYMAPITFNCPMDSNLIVEIASDGNSARMIDNADRIFILNHEPSDGGLLFKNEDGVFIKINGKTATASLTGNISFECSLFTP